MAIKAFELFGTVELRDAKLKSGMQAATREFAQFETKAKGHLKNVENSFSKFGSNFSDGFLSSFNIQRGSGIGSLLGSGAGNLLQSGVKALYGHVTDAMERGMQFADQVQKWKFGFTNLLGSEAAGLAHLRDLIKFGKESAFETEDVVNYAQKLESVKVKASEVKDMLLGIGNAAAGAGNFEKMPNAVLAVYQMLSKNKVGAEEMTQQLAEVIPNPYGFMARGLGISETEAHKLGEEGRLNAQSAVRIMVAQMLKEKGGILDQVVGGTQSGQRAILEDTKSILFAESMLGGDLLGAPGGAYKQYLDNLKKQIGIYGGPEAKKIGQHLGGTAETYYGIVGGLEERMFQSDWFTDLLHGDPSGAKQKLNTLGSFIPEGLRDGVINGSKVVVDAATSVMGGDIWSALTNFWETNSPSKKTERMGNWLREGLEMGLTKGQAKNYANLKELSEKDPDFLRTLGFEAGKRGVNPDDMLNLIAIESGFNKSVMNQYGYGGLGQVGQKERRALGLPVDNAAFKQLLESQSASWQVSNVLMPFLDMKLRQNKGVFRDGQITLAELYSMWGPGSATGNPEHVLMERGGKRAGAYAKNPLWDPDKDGVVREKDLGVAAFNALGAGKFFSINGAPVAKSNPMPVEIMGGSTVVVDPNYKDQGLGSQIDAARNAYATRRLSQARPVETIRDRVPVDGGTAYSEMQPLKTSMIMLTDSALMLKKPLDLLGESAASAATGIGSVKDQIEAEYGAAITEGKKKKKRDPLFDDAFTREGLAGDFHGNLSSLLGRIGWEKTGSLGKQALFGLIRDAQGRLAHDFSSMITGAIFGGRGEDGKLTGGLFGGKGFDLGGIFSKIFGGLFGGFRESGGGMQAGRFYVAGERGPEIVTGPGHVYNNRQTREMMMQGGGDTHVTLALGDRAVAEMNENHYSSRRGMRRMIRVNARYGRAVHV